MGWNSQNFALGILGEFWELQYNKERERERERERKNGTSLVVRVTEVKSVKCIENLMLTGDFQEFYSKKFPGYEENTA